jgi:GT2 family glycosyltransferase
MQDKLGAVVIGRNEGERLVRCLASLGPHTRHVVYVDSGSKDDSVHSAQRSGAHVVILDKDKPFSAARARNEGFAALKRLVPDVEFVQFVDGDCTLAPGWIASALGHIMQRSEIALVCGRRRERFPSVSIYNQLCDLEWNTPVGEALASGGDMLVRTEAFEAVGGFRPQLIAGEEPELCVRLRERGWKIWRIDAEMTLHDAAMKHFSQWWARTVRCGFAYAEVSMLHRRSPQGVWRRETARAILWGGLLPAVICVGAIFHSAAVVGCLLYPIQIVRIAYARGASSFRSWQFAFFLTVGKPAEFVGVVRYHWRRLRSGPMLLIEYK